MPDAMAAAASPCIAPSGSSAITVTDSLAAFSLPAVTPPNLRKSFSLISAAFPVPTTINRSALIPSGAGMSSVDPLLPLNWLAAAARFTVSLALPNAFRVASPNFNPSSQNATRTPRGAAENATKPTLTASDMGKSSRIGAADGTGIRPAGWMSLFGNGPNRFGPVFSALWPASGAAAKRHSGRKVTRSNLLTIGSVRHGSAILLTDQRDGSVSVSRWAVSGSTIGAPSKRDWSEDAVLARKVGTCGNDGVDRPIHLQDDARVVCVGPGQPHRRDLDYAGVARHRPDDEPGPDHHHLSRHHQPGDSGADPGHRADRADDRDLAHAEQAGYRFRNHRDERRRLFPVPAFPAVLLRYLRGGDPGDLHRGIPRA